tara:strand:+ start:1869 stop:2534 length:666 start_codon:yes stop_codon:yes gene_type:complete
MKNILIYGASGHAKVIADILIENKEHNIIGFLDSFKPVNQDIYGFKILGNLDSLPDLIKEYNISGIIIGIGDNFIRKNAYSKISKIAPNLEFITAIHPNAIIAQDVVVSEGTVIMPGTIINVHAKIGRFCILNTKSSLDHDSEMSDFSSLAPSVNVSGNVKIGECSSICLAASIIQNVSIGKYTVVGAGSLVLKSIGDYKQAFGSPISTLKDRKADALYLG